MTLLARLRKRKQHPGERLEQVVLAMLERDMRPGVPTPCFRVVDYHIEPSISYEDGRGDLLIRLELRGRLCS